MKRKIWIIVLLLLLLTLTACGEAYDEEYNYPYLLKQWNSIIYRINIDTATMIPLCPDPLCSHADESCPFREVNLNSMQMAGRYMYCLGGYNNDPFSYDSYYKSIYRIDLATAEIEILHKTDRGSLIELYATEKYLFFNLCTTELVERKDGSRTVVSTYYVWCYNLDKGKAEQLSDTGFEKSQRIYAAENGRLYWSDGISGGNYSTDLAYGDRRDGDETFEGQREDQFCYNMIYADPGFNTEWYVYCFDIIRTDMATGEKKTVVKDVAGFPIFYNNKIIYGKLGHPSLLGLRYSEESGEWEPYYDEYGGKYYICNSDGTGEHLLCDLSELGYEIPVTTGFGKGDSGDAREGLGNWFAIRTSRAVPIDDTGKIEFEGDILLINVETGEVKVVQGDEDT